MFSMVICHPFCKIDVYKRQAVKMFDEEERKMDFLTLARERFSALEYEYRDVEAVSYTHLDVYKRQPWSRARG